MGVDFEYTYVDAEKETAADDTDAFDTDAFSAEEQEFSGSTAKNVAEWIDRILDEENTVRYGKLVRDRIPEIISEVGFEPDVRVVSLSVGVFFSFG